MERVRPQIVQTVRWARSGRCGMCNAKKCKYPTPAIWPGYLPAIQGAASLALRSGEKDEPRLAGWLDEVALRGDDGWREWARARQAGR